jgi:hypothetical protein
MSFLILWFLASLSTIFQLYHGGQIFDGGNRSTPRKPQTCRKKLENYNTQCRIEYALQNELQYHHIDLVVGNLNLTDCVRKLIICHRILKCILLSLLGCQRYGLEYLL